MNPALLVLAVLFGVAGYLEARRFARQYGSTPWGWDPWIWAVVMFLSFLIGVILIAIAERQGRNSAAAAATHQPMGAGQYGYGPISPVAPPTYAAAPGAPVAATAPAASGAGMWAADPSGRFEYRWWDGQQWTASVSRAGVVSQDPPTPG